MSGLLRWSGPASALSPEDREALFERRVTPDGKVRDAVARILQRVRQNGDAALLQLAQELDGVSLSSLEVSRSQWKDALEQTPGPLRKSMERAARNIERAHRAFLPRAVEVETEPGVLVGRRPDALGRVGVYAPGGRAAYPSSVLMGAIPAKVAGVGEIILCSPPGKNGLPSDLVLAAAELSGVTRVFALGGAGAIAALAYGTKTVPRVDRIVGPGNAYVAEAKVQVSGHVGIDLPAGPSEILIIADGAANPNAIAREMLAQAEHDPDASVVALVTSSELMTQIASALASGIGSEKRAKVIAAALLARGALLQVSSVKEAVALSNSFAPEHLLLAVASPREVLVDIRSAGTVFLGETSSVAFGDYLTGANHVLPTGGAGRIWSGLSVQDFLRWTTYQRVEPAAADRLSSECETFAQAEGLYAHAAAAAAWRIGP